MAKLSMYRGDYRQLTVTVTDTKSDTAAMKFAVKSNGIIGTVDSSDSNAIFTVDASGTDSVDNGDGTLTFTLIISEDKTAGKTPGKYLAEIEYADSEGHKSTYDQLEFVLKADINQRS